MPLCDKPKIISVNHQELYLKSLKAIYISLTIFCFAACSSEPETIEYEIQQFTEKAISAKIRFEDNFTLNRLNDSIELSTAFCN